ncbi:hypothetical protein HYH03_018057, partial [Edaphochlamys debaryana]
MAAKAFTVGGIGAQPSIDDVVKIAQGGLQVALDAAGAERIKKESPAPKQFQQEAYTAPAEPSAPSGPVLTVEQARAVLATRLLTVMNGRSGCRLQVAEYMVELLNKGVTPALPAAPTDAQVLTVLADTCHGTGGTVTAASVAAGGSGHPSSAALGSALASAIAAAGLTAPGLSAAERAVLTSGCCGAAGVGALAVAGGRKLLSLATAAAALSCEALGAPTKSFEADVVEAQGYKAAIGAADELLGLLEGSKRVDSLKERGAEPEAMAPFTAAPQRLGALGEALASAYACVRSEVQSGALAAKGSTTLAAPSPQLPAALLALARALLAAARDALRRAKAVGCGVGPAAAGAAPLEAGVAASLAEQLAAAEGSLAVAQRSMSAVGAAMMEDVEALPGVQAALAASAALRAAHEAVALEALAAVVGLRAIE